MRESTFDEQRAFLLSKGVTDAEIAEARKLVLEGGEGTVAGGGGGVQYPPGGGQQGYYWGPPPPPQVL